jgi:hypothetical protein
VNQAIELGWQSLPSSTTKAVVSRSPSETGPWAVLLQQENPVDPYFIRIVDETLHEPRYYQLEVFTNQTVLAGFGPIFLPAL